MEDDFNKDLNPGPQTKVLAMPKPRQENPNPDKPTEFAETVHGKVKSVVDTVTNLPGEQERLMSKPIDILCFGRAGIGKTTLLEALTGRDLGSSARLDHGTTKLECCEVKENIPQDKGPDSQITIRFWDSKGIEKWSSDDVPNLLSELAKNQVNPLCVFYCASGNGRVEPDVVKRMLKMFVDQKIVVFYIITNIYSHNNEQLDGQIQGGLDIMRNATGIGEKQYKDFVWSFGDKGFMLGVNSKPYKSLVGNMKEMNVDTVMQMCVRSFNHEQLAKFFLATLKNRNFWDTAADAMKSAIVYLERSGINVRPFLQNVWNEVKSFLDKLFN